MRSSDHRTEISDEKTRLTDLLPRHSSPAQRIGRLAHCTVDRERRKTSRDPKSPDALLRFSRCCWLRVCVSVVASSAEGTWSEDLMARQSREGPPARTSARRRRGSCFACALAICEGLSNVDPSRRTGSMPLAPPLSDWGLLGSSASCLVSSVVARPGEPGWGSVRPFGMLVWLLLASLAQATFAIQIQTWQQQKARRCSMVI